ncbi:TRAP transporter large permease [Prosthecodimorpha staleyi]|uniref:TRAP transporter large permease subunit n=1 Tax=Prosthecodimorpha staleyi TaxID=2840188 RepID=A0A947D2U3_9HYPH|nr:TRAP transporter large permease subunit [Prosthecodimorpha staleyi]MBT9288566.1 TRAP transporter large permease subunit [Prosthecodimorpha staleyi]
MGAVSEFAPPHASRVVRPDSALATAERILGALVEIPAAVLVVAEIVVLFSGIVARYVLHQPLVWSDELASILFLWLAMLGAAVALRRGEHMRMTALVARLPPAARGFVDALAVTAGLAFLVLIIIPAYHWAYEESFITTPAMEIANAWRAAAFPVGVVLMIVFSLLRLALRASLASALGAALLTAAVVAAFWFAGPTLKPLGNWNLVIFFVGVVGICVFSGVPIVFSFALATLGYLALTTRVPLGTLVGRMDEGMSHLILLAVPLFVFLGLLIEMAGMAKAMVRFLASLLGHVRGGLSYVLIGAMYLVSGISGSKAADMAAVAPALFPEMKARGAKPGDLVALLSATGAQTETIPPSIVLITIGSVTGVSIAALFTGGLLPGVVLAVGLCFVVARRYRTDDLSHVRRATGGEILKAFLIAFPALALPFVIRAAVVEGVATATEVSTIGIVYSLVVGLVFYRQIDWRRMGTILVETAALSGAILIIIGAASAMAWGLTQSGFSRTLAQAMTQLPGGAFGFMTVSVVAFIILGSVLEGIPAIVLFGPLLFPIARAVGIHEVHYAMVVVLAMGLGLFAPPFGVGYYAACAIGKVNPDEGIGPIWAYMLALLVGLIVVAAVPWISIGFL